MKQFKDMTAADFLSHTTFTDAQSRSTGKKAHVGLCRRVNKQNFSNENITCSILTEEIMNVPTVTIHR